MLWDFWTNGTIFRKFLSDYKKENFIKNVPKVQKVPKEVNQKKFSLKN